MLREELIQVFQQRGGMSVTDIVAQEIEARLMMIARRHQWSITRTIRLPDSANVTNGGFNAVTMATSLDDSQVFISGDRRLLVVPVN